MPRARLNTAGGRTSEWKSQALRAYQRRTLAADALIASAYLAGTNMRRVRRAPAALFGSGRQGHGEPGEAQGEERHVPRTTSSETAVALRGTLSQRQGITIPPLEPSPTILLDFPNNGGTL